MVTCDTAQTLPGPVGGSPRRNAARFRDERAGPRIWGERDGARTAAKAAGDWREAFLGGRRWWFWMLTNNLGPFGAWADMPGTAGARGHGVESSRRHLALCFAARHPHGPRARQRSPVPNNDAVSGLRCRRRRRRHRHSRRRTRGPFSRFSLVRASWFLIYLLAWPYFHGLWYNIHNAGRIVFPLILHGCKKKPLPFK